MAGRNFWTTIQTEVRGGPLALWLWVSGILAFIVGFVLSLMDFYTSYQGILLLEAAYGVEATEFWWVLVVMSFTPWLGQIVFFGLWSLDMSRKWALGVAVFWFLLDFVSDVQYHSAGMFIPVGGGVEFNSRVIISMIMTMSFFTIGAELFITAASALAFTLFPDAVREYARIRVAIRESRDDAKKVLNDSARNSRQNDKNLRRNQREQPRAEPPVINASDLVSEEDMLSMFANVPAGREVRQRQGNRNP